MMIKNGLLARLNRAHYIYILKLSNHKYYTGITNNLDRRLREHISGKCKSTRYYRPIYLTFMTDGFNRKFARKIEVYIKNMGAKRFMTKNKTEKLYQDFSKYPEMMEFIIKLKFKCFEMDNEDLIRFI